MVVDMVADREKAGRKRILKIANVIIANINLSLKSMVHVYEIRIRIQLISYVNDW